MIGIVLMEQDSQNTKWKYTEESECIEGLSSAYISDKNQCQNSGRISMNLHNSNSSKRINCRLCLRKKYIESEKTMEK